MLISLLLLALAANSEARLVTLDEALNSTKSNNISLQALEETLNQTQAAKRIAVGMFLPKLAAEGNWTHMGERNEPDMSGLTNMFAPIYELIQRYNQADPNNPIDLSGASGGGNAFSGFVPKADTFSATFSVMVPILTPESIPFARGTWTQHDAMLQRVGHGREQILYGVTKAYFGLVTLQQMIKVAEGSVASANGHFKNVSVRAGLQAATQLQVKRAELEVTDAESKLVSLRAALEKTKAQFRYLTGITGDFVLAEPVLPSLPETTALASLQDAAVKERRDLLASTMEVEVAEREVDKVLAKYFPSVNFIAQGKADNSKETRFDDDPYSWVLLGTVSLNVFDGGIREAQYSIAASQWHQKELMAKDLQAQISSEVEASYQAWRDAQTARRLAARQLDVAHDTQKLAVASEAAGAATALEIIDANTMVYASEAQDLSARLNEATAVLNLLQSLGKPVPFGATTAN